MTKGDRIKAMRERIGLNQVTLADRIGVSKQTLYKYENNIITNIPSDKIEAIAEITGTTPAFIMGWDEQTMITRTLTPDESDLLDDYSLLNDIGKKKARDDVSDLTEIPRYQKTPDHLMPVAAHDRTDIDVTEEMIDEDDLLMADDNLWKKS